MNTLLIGQAEEIDMMPREIRAMLDHQGVYLCGDTAAPEYTVPIASFGGKLYSMQLDDELDPMRFKKTMTIAGPFHKLDVPSNTRNQRAEARRAYDPLD